MLCNSCSDGDREVQPGCPAPATGELPPPATSSPPLPAGSESAIPAPPSPGAAGSGNLAPAQQCSGVTQLVSVCMCVRGTGDGLPCPRNHSLRPGVYAREHACTHTHTPSPSLHTHKQLLHHCTHTHSPCLLHKPLHHCIHTLPLSITHTHTPLHHCTYTLPLSIITHTHSRSLSPSPPLCHCYALWKLSVPSGRR